MTLTHEEIRHFRHSGYWALPVRLPEQVAADLKTALCADIAAEIEPAVLDATGRTVRLSKLLERAPIFYQTATWPPLLDALESLLGPHIELVKNRHNHATLNLATAHISGWWQRWLESFHHAVLYQMRGVELDENDSFTLYQEGQNTFRSDVLRAFAEGNFRKSRSLALAYLHYFPDDGELAHILAQSQTALRPGSNKF